MLAQEQNAPGLHRPMVDSTPIRARWVAAGAKKNSPVGRTLCRNRGGFIVETKPFEFKFRGFELTGEYLSDYLKQLEQSFHESLDRHLKAVEGLAGEQGLKPSKGKDSEHFKWLIRYLAVGKTFEEIGASSEATATADAVGKAVKRLAAELQISLPNRKGRPRRKKTGQT